MRPWGWAAGGLVVCLLLVCAAGAGSPPLPPQFHNATQDAHISFAHFKGSQGTSTILEEAGPGVCVADFDGDGWPDLYFVNGRDLYHRGIVTRNALYRNDHNGAFTDVTASAGVPGTGYGIGCVWGDYDNDGHPDLYVTQYGKNVLYHNNGDGTFTDVTAKAGVDGMDFGTRFHSAATFFDYDRDGNLDLYVGGYANFGPESRRLCNIGYGLLASCRPLVYGGSPAVLYHNNGDGTFTNVTRAAHIYQPKGLNLAAGAMDYDNDGWPDLFVANDGIEAYLYHNNHDGTFKDVALTSGIALTADGSPMAGMCIAFGDYNNDGNLDLLITDFQMATDHLWQNDGKGFFDDVSERSGIARQTRQVLSFGGGFFDYDNDGWPDIFIANGHVYPDVEKTDPLVHYKQINSLLHNQGDGSFLDVTKSSGDGFSVPYLGRGVAFVDYDNDGNVDVVVGNNGDPPLLLHNTGAMGHHFVGIQLVGSRSNRDAMGARIRLSAGGKTQVREISGGGSYLSQSDLRAHFGLGTYTGAVTVDVQWPDGTRQKFTGLDPDSYYRIVEGIAHAVSISYHRAKI
jgi:hypothetical protein